MNDAKTTHAEREERILEYWKKDSTFQKSLDKESPKGEFVFYDGPPFATGTPHYGHILAGTIKDAIPRYKTMQGYHVPRRWGWDCHGLPLENLIEKELGLKTKKDIEELGIEKFNAAARDAVLRYAHIWGEVIPRFGRWVDMENDYKTMDSSYTESVWWAFKTLHNKGLVYEGYKSMQLCPRCGTTLSNFEVNQGYKDITDISVYVKFQIEPNTFLLAWTTTPWTLPGNAALAVGAAITYVKVKIGEAFYILAKERLSVLKEAYTVEKEMLGKDLVGTKYTPVFDMYIKEGKVYPADFVTTTDGTGIVHIAPAFGQDDYELGKKYDLKFIQHVTPDGKMAAPFEGLDAKPKDDHQRTDVEVIKYLAGKGTLFAKEKLVHSYPHCWRCDTPLLNYASSSWFVKVPDFKNKLVSENKKVHWVPESVGQNRFGNWLEGARDWAISRSRYWGAPLPVWKSKNETKVIASLSDIQKACKPRNNIFVMRHGEIPSNKDNLISADITKPEGLTNDGKKQVKKTAESLKNKKIDLVFISPFFRTKETAKIVSEVLHLKPEQIIEDKRLVEVGATTFQGRPWSDVLNMYRDRKEWFERKIMGLETLSEVRKRVGEFIYEIDTKYKDKNILIISHNTPLKIIQSLSKGKDNDCEEALFDNAEVRPIQFTQLPRNREYMIDFHRPFIDEVILHDSKGNEMKRVPEVFDCWFESGSMPFASQPSVRPKWFGKIKGYPAQFIAEGLDQTRGWFYSMLVLGTALFGKSPYQNVIVNGLVLAEDGRKMAKKEKNYPDPMDVANKYGADAVRYFMLTSSVVAGEDLAFSEKGVDEVVKKVINRLDNVITFFQTYTKSEAVVSTSKNILDRWIIARLNETTKTVTEGMEKYELHTATRPLNDFVDDLSTWYLRRSRDRFKDGDVDSLQTTKYVLTELSKLLAPFMPFFAEDMYQRLGNMDSVHLTAWPESNMVDEKIITDMKKTREIVTFGLEARTRFSIKVRQPLAKLSVRELVGAEYLDLIKDEVNVKSVVQDKEIKGEVLLDHVITPELKEEGDMREFLRLVQDMRKEQGLNVGEIARLKVSTDDKTKALVEKNRALLLKVAQIKEVEYTMTDAGTTIIVER